MKPHPTNLWLVVEDSPDDFFLLQRACSHLHPPPKLERVCNGLEGQRYLEGENPSKRRRDDPFPPSVVLSDLNMPYMNGLEFLAWCKNQPGFQQIPFVLLTSSDSTDDRIHARDLGVDEYFIKTGRFRELVEAVQKVAERQSALELKNPEG